MLKYLCLTLGFGQNYWLHKFDFLLSSIKIDFL